MRKLLLTILALAACGVARAEINSIYTFPGGDSGEGQYNSDGIFEGSSYVVFSTTTDKLLILTPPAGSTTTLASYCSSATHVNRLMISTSSTSGQRIYVCESSGSWVLQGGTGGSGTPGGSNTQIQYNNAGAFGGLPLTYDASTGRLGFYQPSPIGLIHIGNTPGVASTNGVIILAVDQSTPGGGHGYVDVSQLRSDAGDSYASVDLRAVTTGYKNFGHLIAVQANLSHASSGTLTTLYELASLPSNSGGRIGTVYGLYLGNTGGTGIIENQYGIYSESLTGGTTSNWFIYEAGGAPSYFGGQIRLATGAVTAASVVGPDLRSGMWFQSLGEINLAVRGTDYFSLQPNRAEGLVVKSTMISNGHGLADLGNPANQFNTLYVNNIVLSTSGGITYSDLTRQVSSATVSSVILPPGSTSYIQNVEATGTLQTPSAIKVDSATVQNNLFVTDSDSSQRLAIYHTALPRSGGAGPQTVETIINGQSFTNGGVWGTLQLRASTTTSDKTTPFGQDAVLILTPGSLPLFSFLGNNGTASFSIAGIEQRNYDADSSNYVALRASDTVAANMTIIQPASVGTVGQVRTIVSVAGSTVTENWQTPTGGGGGNVIGAGVGGVIASTPMFTLNAATGVFTGSDSPTGTFNLGINLTSVTVQGYLTASTLELQKLGSPPFHVVQDFANSAISPGWISGGTITVAGSGIVNISSGNGWIKSLDVDVTTNYFMNWPSSGSVPIPLNTTIFFGVKYNAGSPIISTKATDTFDLDTEWPIGSVTNEGGSLYISTTPWKAADNNANLIERFDSLSALSRDNRLGGLILSNTGTRNVAVTVGALMARMNEFNIAALDTSASSTFDHYYRNGSGGWTVQKSSTAWNNSQYDDASGTLATLTALNYTSRWFYVTTDGRMEMLYGQAQYTTLAGALNDGTPSSVPPRILNTGILIGRFIIQASGSTPSVTQSAFGTAFTAASVTNFSDLAGTADISSQTNLAVTSPIVLTGDTLSFANSGTTPGSYTASNVTVNAQGLITAISSGVVASSFSFVFRAEAMHVIGSSQPYISYSTGEVAGSIYFDDTSTQAVTMSTILTGYHGGTLFADLIYVSTATTGTTNNGVYIACNTPSVDTENMDVPSYGTINSSSTNVGGTANMALTKTITLTNQDSCANGDVATLLLTREAGISDSAAGFQRPRFLIFHE